MKLGGFAITHRRPEVLRETLGRVLDQEGAPEEMLVVDNGRCAATRAVVEELRGRGVSYVDPGDNLGPAGAAALGLEWALGRGHDWIYWCDDDDPPKTPDTFVRLRALAARLEAGTAAGDPPVAAVAAVGAHWDWRRGRLVRPADHELAGPVEVDAIGGNSQLLLAAPAVRAAGLPDPALFFGWEEIEYCLRLRRAGYRLVIDGDLAHRYRTLAGRLRPAAARRPGAPDSLWRDYYAVRNYIHLMRRRFGRADLARREAVKAVARTFRSLGHGPSYALATARHQLRGVVDGYRGRLGRTVEPRREKRSKEAGA